MSKVSNAEPDFEDGTNVLVGTAYREQELVGRVTPWYLPSESRAPANWKDKWVMLRVRMERLIDECQPVECTLIQWRVPAFGVERTIDPKRYPGLFLAGGGLEGLPARLLAIDRQPLAGIFPIRSAKGEPIQTADGQPQAFRFGLSRYFILSASSSYQGDARPVPHPRFPELARDGTALLYELPAEVAVTVWKNWSKGFSRGSNCKEFLWLDALFELSWQSQPGSALSASRSTQFGSGSIGLVGDGLFPRLPTFKNWPLLDSIPNDGGNPMACKAKLTDVARASVAAIDEILERGSKTANVPSQPRSKGSLPTSLTTSFKNRSMKTTKRDKVFVSYSHKDKKLFGEFKTMLSPALRQGTLDLWDDTKVKPGAKWKDEIQAALASARVAVLLVSQHFLASDFIAKHELPPLLKAAQEEGVTVFWIYFSSCLYEQTEIATYQAAHGVSKPLDRLDKPHRQAVLSEICAKLVRMALNPIGPPPRR